MNNDYENELSERLKSASSFNTHFANVISGMNHEVSPWLGSIANMISRMESFLSKIDENDDSEEIKKNVTKCKDKIKKLQYASDQASHMLSMMSKNVKLLQTYSLVCSNVKDTIYSWVQVTLVDQLIKSSISEKNIHIDYDSLNFSARHSPMFLSQVILNLAKNSVEHNLSMLEDLEIKIYGCPHAKKIIFEDNGCGIDPKILPKIFRPGITTKQCEVFSHGLGLAACMEYCVAMDATIWVESQKDIFTRFNLKLENSYEECKEEVPDVMKDVYEEYNKKHKET